MTTIGGVDCKVSLLTTYQYRWQRLRVKPFAHSPTTGKTPHPSEPKDREKEGLCWSEAVAINVTIVRCLMLIFKIHVQSAHYMTWQTHSCSIQKDNVFPRFSSTIYVQRNSPFPVALLNLLNPPTHTHTPYTYV